GILFLFEKKLSDFLPKCAFAVMNMLCQTGHQDGEKANQIGPFPVLQANKAKHSREREEDRPDRPGSLIHPVSLLVAHKCSVNTLNVFRCHARSSLRVYVLRCPSAACTSPLLPRS